MQLVDFQTHGFAVAPDVISISTCQRLDALTAGLHSLLGTRAVLTESWCTDLVSELRASTALSSILPKNWLAVQCTYFAKSATANWLVPVHQDLSIPVATKVNAPQLTGWSVKEGIQFVQAPMAVLESLVAVRIHLDDCGENDGPLYVVPGSHKLGVIDSVAASIARATEIVCPVPLAGAMAMRPLLLHRSSKATGNGRRRVLHFVFGPPQLPFGLQWRDTA